MKNALMSHCFKYNKFLILSPTWHPQKILSVPDEKNGGDASVEYKKVKI